MSTFVSDFTPKVLWSHFDRLMEIPRGSKSEDGARAYVLEVADRMELEAEVDKAGNVLVRKSAAPGREQLPGVILQAHLDMVQEKNSDVDHDFATEPIRPIEEGDWLTADGTTLGADNGIGVAAMLAIMEADDVEHGPLEFLFTIDEETGLTGAKHLAEDLLQGRRLINLDSEEEGVVTIGCAGGGDAVLRRRLSAAPVTGGRTLRVSVAGLKGGHSGVDIHLQRGNAIRILARAVLAAADEVELRVVTLSGGNARNAIPREASAILWLADPEDRAACRAAMDASFAVTARELARSDPGFRHAIDDAESVGEAWEAETSRSVLDLLNALPHGVMAMSLDLPGLVETSVNLAVARPENGRLFIMQHCRSSIDGALRALRRRVRSIGELAGAEVTEDDPYPGWQPDVDSALLARIRATYEDVMGEAPEVGAMHAGLECGLIGEKYEGMDMVSFGPQIEFPHSPDERVRIGSVAPFFDVLCRTLERVADE